MAQAQPLRHGYLVILTYILLLSVLLTFSVYASPISSIGPVGFLRKNGSYAWEATTDRGSGLASSTETSFAPAGSRLFKSMDKDLGEDVLQSLAGHLFADYAIWLSQLSVTFGLFKAVPVVGGGFKFQTRVFGLNLLTFGRPSTTKLTLETKGRDGKTIRSSQCTVTIPVVGGVMSCRRFDGEKTHKSHRRGALKCTLSVRQARAGSSSKDGTNAGLQTSCSIVTRLVDFCPRLVGHPPVNALRARLYLSTQSLVHAYVMWRLHRRCWNSGYPQTN